LREASTLSSPASEEREVSRMGFLKKIMSSGGWGSSVWGAAVQKEEKRKFGQ